MTNATDEPVIALRARSDLIARPQIARRRRFWCVKDPVALAYFQLSDEEYALLQSLDGRQTLASLRQDIERRTPGAAVSRETLQSFLAGLRRSGLVTAEIPNSGDVLWQQRQAGRARAFWTSLTNILAIRFRGIDPSGLLRRLEAAFGWLLSPASLLLAAVFVAAAIVFALTRFGEFVDALPTADAFFTPANLVVLLTVIGGVKVLHELGHGLTCRRFGGECHEIGVMFLVFAPCLYCDVTDSWMFPRKRHRIAVAAAGIAVELVLAAAATFGWWFSEPGLFHAVCMNVMLVCSINTLWLNGNPLLRYDGYFVLSDLLEIPNLASESRAAMTRLLFGGDPTSHRPSDGSETVLVAYGIASAVYRVALTCFIVWMLLQLLTPLGLAPAAYAIAVLCAVTLVTGPVLAIKSALLSPRRGRAVVVLAIGLAAVIAATLLPLPRRIEAAAVLQPRGAHRIYARVGGRLLDAPAPGSTVERGELLFRLDDPELERDVAKLKGRHVELTTRLDALQSRRFDNAAAAAQLSAVQRAMEGVAAQLETRRRSLGDLQIIAPADGTVLPPPVRPARETPGELPDWSGSPLDRRNRGCFIESGTLLCLVGDPERLEVMLYVVEDDVEAIQPGQLVRILPDQTAGTTLGGVVEAVSANPLRVVPQELARSGVFPARPDADGLLRPIETTYEVRVRFDDEVDTTRLRARGIGRAKITAGTSPPADRLWRFLRRTFRFDLS